MPRQSSSTQLRYRWHRVAVRAVDGHEYDPRDDQPIGEAGLQSDPLLGHQPVGEGERRGVGRGMGRGMRRGLRRGLRRGRGRGLRRWLHAHAPSHHGEDI